jgi:hypothetical protein
MEDIFFSGTPLLEAVGIHEPFVEELRETVRNAILKSLIPMKAYVQQYEKHLAIMNLDINSYIRYDLKPLLFVCYEKRDHLLQGEHRLKYNDVSMMSDLQPIDHVTETLQAPH